MESKILMLLVLIIPITLILAILIRIIMNIENENYNYNDRVIFALFFILKVYFIASFVLISIYILYTRVYR